MARYATGVTLKSSDPASVSQTGAPIVPEQSSTKTISSHACEVTLPNGATCSVDYRRYQAKSHAFTFHAPIGQRLLVSGTLRGSAAIEHKAQELASEAFRKAQESEQQEMRRKTPGAKQPGARPDDGPEMEAATAERLAGRYAACFRTETGRLIRLGPAYLRPEAAVQEIQDGTYQNIRLINGQALVVGICNRVQRRWVEPQFLSAQAPEARCERETTQHTEPHDGAETPSDAESEEEETR